MSCTFVLFFISFPFRHFMSRKFQSNAINVVVILAYKEYRYILKRALDEYQVCVDAIVGIEQNRV